MKRLCLVAGVLFLCSCKSGEEKYCEQATVQHVYDPQRPGLCQETYRNAKPTDRECLDKCMAKTPDAVRCGTSCNIGVEPANIHHTPPAPSSSQ
jgi:hypothetical protein